MPAMNFWALADWP